MVALRKESVDRNGMEINGVSYDVWSLSARRAWIEIIRRMPLIRFCPGSLSVRRAWIEITRDADWVRVYVSLSVRRVWIEMVTSIIRRIAG